jgi:hypothetical protein
MNNEQKSIRIALFGLPPGLIGFMVFILFAANIFVIKSCWSDHLNPSTSSNVAILSEDELRQACLMAIKDAERVTSYSNTGYPWTRLGYTYDWGNPKSEIGLSEFVIKNGAPIKIHSVVNADAYCN